LLPRPPGPTIRDPRGRRLDRCRVAGSLGVTASVHPRRYDALAGLAFPGDPDGHPVRDEVIAYLERYAAAFELPVELNSAVRSLTSVDGRFVLGLDDKRIEADQVVVATGPFQVPAIPGLAAELSPEVFQRHSTGYLRPSD